ENDMGRDAGSLNDGLVAYWKLDEGNGNIIHDCSGNGNDGIIYGAKWTSGICGNALNFDGYNDHVDIFSPVWNTAPYSICVWVKSDTFIGNHYIIANGGETRDSYGFYMKIDWSVSDGDWRFGVSNKDGSRYGDAHAPPASGGWTFLCGTWDGSADPSEIKLYVNGTLEDTGSASYNWRTGSSNNLRIGGPSNAINYLFDGLIDEIRIYNRVLNEEEIRFLYNHPGGGSPPSADFKVNKTGDPRIIEFNAVGSNLTDCLLKWDLNGDKKWDKIGWFNDTKTVLYEYPEAGVYNATLYVENPVGNNSCTKKFAVLTNYNINWSNHGFFLSYPTTTLTPPLKNKYVFKCSPGVLDHVVFQFGNKNYSDNTPSLSDNSDVWEAVINMNEGKHGDKIKVLGYDRENNLIWEDEADTFILITPPWFNAFLLLSDITVYNSENYSYWNITIVPPNIGLGYKMDKVPVKYIGGKYGVNATVTGPQNFTIESSQTLTVYYPLCSLDIPLFSTEHKTKKPVNLGSYKKARWNINVDFAATADVQINPKEVALAGCLTLQGDAGVSFDVPVAGIPFLAEAGLSGGVDAEFGTRFVIARLADNGFTFCPEGFSNVFFDLEGQAGLYAQVLWGLGRLEGGLYAGGKLNMKLPSLETYMHLYGGVYAKACCWKWCSEWSYGIEFESTDDSFKWKRLTDTRTRSTENMDLLCLKDSNRKTPPHERSLNSSLNVLAYNVVGNAYPKIVLTEKGDGVAVWTDINWVDNNSFQSDIWWSKYSPDIGWSKPQNINTTNSCEYNPTLTVITNNNGSQKVLMTFLKINNVININSSINDFYKNNTICTAVLTPADTWRFSDKNISAFNGTINSKQVCDAGNNTVYMVYLVDTDSHPWKNGNGSIKLVKGFVNNSTVEWQQPLVLKTLDSFNFNCDPCVSFLTPNVGGVGYTWFNETSGWNETILLATSSGLNFTELTIRNTNLTVEYTCCSTFNNSIIVSWIENRSKILSRQINVDDSDPKNWTMNNITEIYSGLSISYIKPIYTNQHIYYLFQAEKEF
ncbi:MAG TPA: hypothetical protein ENI42_03665, partial [Thermoplasmatales archaeon]|nr:hypothetical protein [Thermoplasmatales archaeon]